MLYTYLLLTKFKNKTYIYRVSMFLFCLSHNFVYLLYFCPSLDKS